MARERDVVFSWTVSPVSECSNLMTVFTLSCSPSPSSLPQSPSSGPLTVTGLSPDTSYSCSLVAGGRFGPQPSANTTFTTHEDYSFIQLRFSGVLSTCAEEVSSERSLKLQHITAAVVEVLQASCGECVSDMAIDNQFFVCYPESPSHMTYRARLEGTLERESGSLISLIEEWVRGGASVIVTGVLMTVDPDCSVAISSLSEGECSPNVAEDLGDTNDGKNGGGTTPIIAGIVTVTVVIIITVAIVVIVFLVLKNCHGELSLKKSNTHYEDRRSPITTATNEAYGKVKGTEIDDGYELTDFSSPPLPSSSAKLEESLRRRRRLCMMSSLETLDTSEQ